MSVIGNKNVLSTKSPTRTVNCDDDAEVTMDMEAPRKSGVTDLIQDVESKNDSSDFKKLQKTFLSHDGLTQAANIVAGLSETAASFGPNVTGPTRNPEQTSGSVSCQDGLSLTTNASSAKTPTTKPVAKVAPFDRECSCTLCVNTLKHSASQPQRSERTRNQDPARDFPTESRSGSNRRRSLRFTRHRPGIGLFRGIVFESDSD